MMPEFVRQQKKSSAKNKNVYFYKRKNIEKNNQ